MRPRELGLSQLKKTSSLHASVSLLVLQFVPLLDWLPVSVAHDFCNPKDPDALGDDSSFFPVTQQQWRACVRRMLRCRIFSNQKYTVFLELNINLPFWDNEQKRSTKVQTVMWAWVSVCFVCLVRVFGVCPLYVSLVCVCLVGVCGVVGWCVCLVRMVGGCWFMCLVRCGVVVWWCVVCEIKLFSFSRFQM